MKNKKLEISDIGKKFVYKDASGNKIFLLLAITSNGDLVGEGSDGGWAICEKKNNSSWIPYEKEKQPKRIEAAPAVIKKPDGEYAITPGIGISREDFGCSGTREVVKWPADWDNVKKVRYYEWDE